MATPVFIVGKHRSGTTWLANILCNHPSIAGIQHDMHFGIHESAYFSHIYNRYGDISRKPNFVEFVETQCAGDYFRLAGADKSFVYSLYPSSYPDIFRAIMDNFANKLNKPFWIEKTPRHTLYISQLMDFYPDAKFVGIVRNVFDTVLSSLYMNKKEISKYKRKKFLFSTASIVRDWVAYNRFMEYISKKTNRILVVNYEDIISDPCNMIKIVCDFIGVVFYPEIINVKQKPNTSFIGNSKRAKFSKNQILFIAIMRTLFSSLPLPVLYKYVKRISIKSSVDLPSWYFRLSQFYSLSKDQ